ncbi:MAG TPA: glycosyltransferase, partial [Solirubrobacterales bacterium]|nr:glycosyltransferase [Solirubrobacterales bacterium]
MSYSLVVVTWNCAERLRDLVASLNRHLDGNQELVVVDNDSRDDPERAAQEWKGAAEFIALDENVGF